MTDDQLSVVLFAAGVVALLLALMWWEDWNYRKGNK